MGRLALEIADIFRAHGPAWRDAQNGHLSLEQLKVMSAIEQCRTATLGGHVLYWPLPVIRKFQKANFNTDLLEL